MKNLLCILCVLLVLQACNIPAQNDQNAPPKPNYTKFDLFVKRFIKQHPNMNDNDILKQEANDEFKKQLVNFFKDSSGITYIRLYVKSINKIGKGYVVHFMSDAFFQIDVFHNRSDIDVFALVDKQLARSLKQSEGDKYYIRKYTKLTFLKKEAVGFVTNDYVYYYDVELNSERGNSYGNYILGTKDIQHY